MIKALNIFKAENGISNKDIASVLTNAVGINYSTNMVSKRNNSCNYNVKEMNAICKCYGGTVDKLFGN